MRLCDRVITCSFFAGMFSAIVGLLVVTGFNFYMDAPFTLRVVVTKEFALKLIVIGLVLMIAWMIIGVSLCRDKAIECRKKC